MSTSKLNQPQELSQIALLLKSIDLFSSLGEESLQILAKQARKKTFESGEIVFLEGDLPGGIYIVQDGWLKATKVSRDGREQILDTIGPRYAINAHTVFTHNPLVATLTALEPSTLWIIPANAIIKLIEAQPKAAMGIVTTLARRIEFLVNKIEDLSLRSVESRLARHLMENQTGGIHVRKKWATQAKMAAELGTVLDVLNRTLKNFEEHNLIKVNRDQILIIDMQAIKNIAAD